MILVSVCLPSDALSPHLLSYLGFSYLGHWVSLHGCASKEGWALKNWASKLWWRRRVLRVPWTARRSNQLILKEINTGYSLDGLMLKVQYFGHLTQRADSLARNPDAGKNWRQEEKGMTEDKMVGWHHWLNGPESEQTPGVVDRQGILVCCSLWDHKESDTTKQLNWTKPEKYHWNMNTCSQSESLLEEILVYMSKSQYVHYNSLEKSWLQYVCDKI